MIIDSAQALVTQINQDIRNGIFGIRPLLWFRGQPCDLPLIPSIFRGDRSGPSENDCIQLFRTRSQTIPGIPNRRNIDEWLCLMQHSLLPTRLLDWSEGILIALYFSLIRIKSVRLISEKIRDEKPQPVIWILNPLKLNLYVLGDPRFPIPWIRQGNQNFRKAFELQNPKVGTTMPYAVLPTYIHPRMQVQRGGFTIHGECKAGLEQQFEEFRKDNYYLLPGDDDCFLTKYVIDIYTEEQARTVLNELRTLGISHYSLFPDFEGLAADIVLYPK